MSIWAKEVYLPFGVYVSSPMPLAPPGPVYPYAASVPRDLSLARWNQSLFVAPANNGANYWTIDLVNITLTVIASFNTSTIAANTWNPFEIFSFNPQAISRINDITLFIQATATGAPGAIYIAGPGLLIL